MTAGDEAYRSAAYADAAYWYDCAAECGPTIDGTDGTQRGPKYVAAMIKRADVARCLGHPDQADRLFNAVTWSLELSDPVLISQSVFAALQLGATSESGQVHELAADAVEAALDILPTGNQRGLILAASTLVMSMTEQSSAMRDRFLEAESMTDDTEIRGHVLPFAYLSLGHPQDLRLRLRFTKELSQLSTKLRSQIVRFEALQLQFSNSIMTANGDELRRLMVEFDSIAPYIGDIGRRWSLLYQRAALAHIEGRLHEAEEISNEALELFSPVSSSRAFAAYGGQILPLRIAQDRIEELSDTLWNLLADQPEVPAWNAAYALAIATTNPDKAALHAAQVRIGTSRDFLWLAAHVIAARAVAIIGDTDLCVAFMDDLRPWSGLVCWQGTCSYGPVDTVLGQLAKVLGNEKDAAKYRRQARRQADSMGSIVFWDDAAAI